MALGNDALLRSVSFYGIVFTTLVTLYYMRRPVYSPQAKALPQLERRKGKRLPSLEDDVVKMAAMVNVNDSYDMVPTQRTRSVA